MNLARWIALLLLAGVVGVTSAQDVDDKYRFTIFPWYKLSNEFTVYAHLGYSFNPDQENHVFNFVSPGFYYTPRPWVQLWEGFMNRYTDNGNNQADQLELRPFLGVKLFVPNDWKINLYNFTRYEYRAVEDLDTHLWDTQSRIRSRFGAEIPLVSRKRAWHPKTWYALANLEPFYNFDGHTLDPLQVCGGIGYVLDPHVQIEFLYYAQFARQNGGPLEYTENILRFNVKIGLNREHQAPGPTPSY